MFQRAWPLMVPFLLRAHATSRYRPSRMLKGFLDRPIRVVCLHILVLGIAKNDWLA
jgi:hypothetical protein